MNTWDELPQVINNSVTNLRNYDDIQWLSRIYALFCQSNPDLIRQIHYEFSRPVIVAASLISSTASSRYAATITSESETKLRFSLDLDTKDHQSKGNWIWVTQLDLYYAEDNLLSIATKRRVIDIPYCGTLVSAYWLFKNFYPEFLEYFNNL